MRKSALLEAILTVWETDPKLRVKNNIICFLLPEDKDVIPGYCVLGRDLGEYLITKILEAKPASMKGYTFYKVKTSYTPRPAFSFNAKAKLEPVGVPNPPQVFKPKKK